MLELPRGTRIGTVQGYRYPGVEEKFESGFWKREEAPDERRQLTMLQNGRVHYSLIKGITMEWAKKEVIRPREGGERALVTSSAFSFGVFCAVPKESGEWGRWLLSATEKASQDQRFQEAIKEWE